MRHLPLPSLARSRSVWSKPAGSFAPAAPYADSRSAARSGATTASRTVTTIQSSSGSCPVPAHPLLTRDQAFGLRRAIVQPQRHVQLFDRDVAVECKLAALDAFEERTALRQIVAGQVERAGTAPADLHQQHSGRQCEIQPCRAADLKRKTGDARWPPQLPSK